MRAVRRNLALELPVASTRRSTANSRLTSKTREFASHVVKRAVLLVIRIMVVAKDLQKTKMESVYRVVLLPGNLSATEVILAGMIDWCLIRLHIQPVLMPED